MSPQLCAAQRRAGLHPAVVAADFDPARPHGQLTWRSHDGVPVAEIVNTWQFANFEGTYRDPVLTATLAHVLDIVQPHVLHVHNLLNLSFELPALARARGIAVAATLARLHAGVPVGRPARPPRRVACLPPHRHGRCARCFPASPFHTQWRYGQLAASAPAAGARPARLGDARAGAHRATTAAGDAAWSTARRARSTPPRIERRLAAARTPLRL